MKSLKRFLPLFFFAVSFSMVARPAFALTIFEVVPYKSEADSPFNSTSFEYYYLENFEDGNFNLPKARLEKLGNPDPVIISSAFQSVDGDDADSTNGSCVGCKASGWTFADTGDLNFGEYFIAGELFPTHAGFVLTNLSPGAAFTVAAYGGPKGSLGFRDYFTLNLTAGTDDDLFVGFYDPEGISDLFFGAGFADGRQYDPQDFNYAIDHVQFGRERVFVPEPSTLLIFGAGITGLCLTRKKK